MKIVKLGGVVDLFNGSTPLKTNKNYWVNGNIPWFTVDDLRKQGKYITYTEKFITKLGLKESSISLIPENAVLLCCTASVGAIAINKIRLTTNQQFNALVVKNSEQLFVEFLYYWFLANMDTLKSLGRATTIDYISMSKLRDMAIQLPPLQKQREIVEKLDCTFAEIDLLEENLKVSEENAIEVQQSLLSASFRVTEFPPGKSNPSADQDNATRIVKLSEVCLFSRGLTYSKSDEVAYSSNVVLRANNIDLASNSLNLEDLRYIRDSIKIKKEKTVKKNSLIICTASGSKSHVGKVALIDEDYGYAFGGFMGQLTPTDDCHPKFLYYVLTSGLFKDFLMSLNDGTNINNLKFSDIEDYEIELPTLQRQTEFIEKLDSAFAEIEKLKAQIKMEKDYAVSLRQALLSSAFSKEEVVV